MRMVMNTAARIVVILGLLLIQAQAWATMSAMPSATSYTGSYTVNWTDQAGCDDDEGTYECWRLWEKKGSGSWTYVSVGFNATSHDFSGKSIDSYQYRICYSAAGNPTWSTLNCGTVDDGPITVTVTKPSPPTVPASDTDGDYTVSWSSLTGASTYDLQEVINGGSTWTTEYSGSSPSAQIQNTGDGIWHYRVRACDASGCGAYSNSSSGIYVANAPGAPGKPSITPGTSTDGTHTISWSAASGTVDRYELYRSYNGGGFGPSPVYNGSSRSTVKSGLASGNYTYYVRGCNDVQGFPGCGGNSTTSDQISVNYSPIATADSTSTNEDTEKSYNVVTNDTGPEAGDSLTVVSVVQPEHGVAIIHTDLVHVVYTPFSNYHGSDSLTYTVSDSHSTDTATLSITVNGVNDAPVASDDEGVTIEDVGIELSVLNNDTDADQDTLSITGVSSASYGSTGHNGTTVTYTPNLGYIGGDSFTYTVSDGNGGSDTATVAVQVDSNTVNDDDGDYTVSWNAASGSVASYKLEERLNAGAWTEVQNTAALNKPFTGKANGVYAYRVSACNASGCSDTTPVMNAVVNYPPPGQVTDLTAPIGSSDGDAPLSWTAATGEVTYHVVEETFEGLIYTYDTQSALTSFTITDLTDNGRYRYRVRACNSNDCGAYSDAVELVLSEADTVTSVPALTSTSAESLESALGPVFNGIVPGAHDVTGGGAATYSIALQVPPGTNGMQPSLGLGYSSQNQHNGLVGYGWSLNGVGTGIVRCGLTLPQNGDLHAVDYTGKDRFCYQGQQLVVADGDTYGADDSEYRTAIDSFHRVTSHTSSGTEPDGFTVEARDGLILYFGNWDGNSGDAFIEAEGKTVAAQWMLKRVEDRSGNAMVYHYEKDTEASAFNGDFRPLRIEYTVNDEVSPALAAYAKVEFEYEARTDVIVGYRAGSQSKQSKRLAHIKTYVDADFDGTFETGEWVRDYGLTYNVTDSTDFPRLADITLCAPDGGGQACTPATTFEWESELNGYALAGSGAWTGQSSPGAFQKWGDFNGDGRMDYVTSSGATHYVSLAKGDASGYESVASWTAYAKGTSDFESLADLNGDGLADYFTTDNDGDLYWALSNGTDNYSKTTYATGHTVTTGDVQELSDFNGDGLPDYLLASGTSYTVRLNNAGSGYQSSQSWSGGPDLGAATVDAYSFHDVNRDGRTDLVTIDDTTHSVYIATDDLNGDGTKTDPGFKSAQTWNAHASGDANGFWVDLNGDGLIDYVTIGGTNSDEHYVSLSTGTGYANHVNPWMANALDAGSVPVFRDINGDGLTDYISADVNGDHRVSLSNGRTGYDNVLWENGTSFGSSDVFDFVDLDGDGKLDFVSTNTNGTHNVAINRSQPVHLMIGVTDGLGVETDFVYRPLTDTTVYTKGSGANTPAELDMINPTYVVAEMHHSDGVGGMLSAEYHYEGFKYERGRGSLGFATVTVTDTDRGTKVISEFEQTWPKTGLLKHTELRLTSNNRLLKESDFVYGVYESAAPFDDSQPAANQSQFTAIISQTDKVYDADDGRHLSTATTTYTDASDQDNIDGYGNRQRIRVMVVDKEDSDKDYTTVTTRTLNNDSTNWLLGQVTQEVVHKDIDGFSNTAYDLTTSFTYDSKGRVKVTTRQPSGSAPEKLVKEVFYDDDSSAGFGNAVKEEVSGPGITTRDEEVGYDTRGRFALTLTNAEGHQQTQTYDESLGVLETVTGPNGLTMTRDYDVFGRLVKETSPDGTWSEVGYFRVDWVTYPTPTGIADRPFAAVYTEVAEYENDLSPVLTSAPVRLFADAQGRSLRQRVKGFDGTYVHTDTEYDSQGRMARTSQPYHVGETVHWNTPTYDAVNRVVGMVAADATQSTTTDYDGFAVTVTDNKGRATTQIQNAIGQLVETVDAQLNRTTYEYDLTGQPVKVRTGVVDALTYDTQVTNTYDRFGRRLTMDDPDAGLVTWTYNALGEVVETETPELAGNTQSVTYDYDLLGRPVERQEPETFGSSIVLKSIWTYDNTTSGNLGKGRLYQETLERIDGMTTDTPFVRTYFHDSGDDGRLSQVQTEIDGTDTYTVDWVYDSAGRISQVLYPTSPSYPTTPFTVEYYYNPRGYLEKVYEAGQASSPFYQTTGVDAEGRITQEYLGDTSLTGMGYATGSGRLLYTHASRDNSGSPEAIQNLVYQYDAAGNLTARSDLINELTETFEYDVLDRLTQYQVTNPYGTENPVTFAYNAMGNLTTKGDLGTLTYPLYPNTDPRPHAVTGVNFNGGGSATYTYDDNGNMTGGDGRTISWYSFDKPKSIIKNGVTRNFYYGPDRSRYKQGHSDGTTTHYVAGELFTYRDDGSVETYELTVFAYGQAVAVVVDEDNGSTVTKTEKYLHRDHLGSITAITDLNGSTLNIEQLSYDAFGQRRNASTWVGSAIGTPSLVRGFTGHEHLDDVDIIHMNGRIYDPTLGRMLSPDPIVQAPTNSQNWNRYSYAFNNPLGYTDPSGYFSLNPFKAVKKVGNFVGKGLKKIGKNLVKGLKNTIKDIVSFDIEDIIIDIASYYICGAEGESCQRLLSESLKIASDELLDGGGSRNPRDPVSVGGLTPDNILITESDMNAVAPGSTQKTPAPPGKGPNHSNQVVAKQSLTQVQRSQSAGSNGNGALDGSPSLSQDSGLMAMLSFFFTGAQAAQLYGSNDLWNRKGQSRHILVERQTDISDRELINATDWEMQVVNDGIDDSTLTLGKRLLGRLLSSFYEQGRIATYGQYREVDIYRYRTVYDLINGNIVNEQIITGSEEFVTNDRILIPNTVESMHETRQCILLICSQ